jgi:hypothetical protein
MLESLMSDDLEKDWSSKPCPSCLNFNMNVYTIDEDEPSATVIIVCTNCGVGRVARLESHFEEIVE